MNDGLPDISWLGRLAHDLRGPLSPLLMAANLLSQPGLDPSDRSEMEAMLNRQAAKLAAMIGELADWGAHTEGRLVGQKAPSDLEWLLQTALGTLDPSLMARVRIETSGEYDVDADVQRLVQAFATLMRVRHALAPADALLVRAGTDNGRTLRIEIGAPLAAEEQWIHAKDAPFPEKDSLGLGLPLAIAIIEAHDGTLAWLGQDDAKTWTCTLPSAS